MSLIAYIQSGGIIMEILIAMNTLGVALMLYKGIQFWQIRRQKEGVAKAIMQEIAIDHAHESWLPILKELLQSHLKRMEGGMSTIQTIASTATLFGLLGTVIGILIAFEAIAKVGMGDPTIFAKGVAMALVTTVGGLIVALIHTIGYNYLVAYLDRIEAELQELLLQKLLKATT